MLDVELLGRAFGLLDRSGFAETSRLPLFAARHWSPQLEMRTLERFRQGLCNIEEVAVPRWYWAGMPNDQRQLFEVLSLGRRGSSTWSLPAELSVLLDARGAPRWRVVARFERYVLHSPPDIQDATFVYFGDDTLFLMGGARNLLERLDGEARILDLCCGGGGVGMILPPWRGELHGIDINPTAVGLAEITARAQGLSRHSYQVGDATSALDARYDLIVGNPPTLPPDLVGQDTLYATGARSRFLDLMDGLVACLTARGRALVTAFSLAGSRGEGAPDELRAGLAELLGPSRGYQYMVRRHFPLGDGNWLRHVAVEILPESDPKGERFFDVEKGSVQLPGLAWRRGLN